MSDNARTTLAFPVLEQPVENVVTKLVGFFEPEADTLLVRDPETPSDSQPLFRPIAETPGKYQKPEWLEREEPEPDDKGTLVRLATKYRNFAVHTTFNFAAKVYQGSMFIYDVASLEDRSSTEQTFVRLSFHSALTYALRGTREFGGPVVIDPEIKGGLMKMALGLCAVLGAKGFAYGLERDGPLPFSVQQLRTYLCDPIHQLPPIPAFVTGIDRSIVSRSDLIRVWEEESVVKVSTTGLVLLDLLRDSECWVEEDEEAE